MLKSRLILVSACVGALCSLTQCVSPSTDGGTGTAGTNGSAGTNGDAGTNGSTGTAGTTGNTGTAGTTATAGTTGTTGSAGTGAGGSTSGTAGRGGTTGTAGTTGRGGTTGTAGTGTAGTVGTAGTGGTAVRVDMAGQPLAKPGDMTNVTEKYLNLGDMRLINNRWGSDARIAAGASCGTTQSVFVNTDRSVGYMFMRPACGGARAYPDFPEIEFGVAPFGSASSLLTSPPFSSTTLLPIQIKSLTSASITLPSFTISISGSSPYWDNNVEFWISRQDPRGTDGQVYAEVIAFTGFQTSRLQPTVGWPCDKTGSVTAGTHGWNLCHQSDDWSSGHWRFFNFNMNGSPVTGLTNFKLDVRAMLQWVMNTYSGFNQDMWLTRIEVGTEVDDNTNGTARLSGVQFEVNGTTKSIELQ